MARDDNPDSCLAAASVATGALPDLLRVLLLSGYRFVTPTPATHARYLANRGDAPTGSGVRDLFGWSLPVPVQSVSHDLVEPALQSGAIIREGHGLLRPQIRVSTLGDCAFAHSTYPTDQADAVFFGPDSYRYAAMIEGWLALHPLGQGARIADIGGGAGIGAIVASRMAAKAGVAMTDTNARALAFARANAASAGVDLTIAHGSNLDGLAGTFDLITANPPYLADAGSRTYRDGGADLGGAVSLDMAAAALPRLRPGGHFLLYTGSAIIDGEDRILAALADLARTYGCRMTAREIDPDVFGEELEQPAYRAVERIALIAAAISRPVIFQGAQRELTRAG